MSKPPSSRRSVREAAARPPRELLLAADTGPHPFTALLGLTESDPIKLAARILKGLGFGAFARFQRASALTTRELTELVQIPLRTLHRRRKEGRFQPDESDRLVRASRLFGRSLDLFEGDAPAARAWLLAPQPALAGARPLDLARTDVGAREVENLIGRLEHGIPS